MIPIVFVHAFPMNKRMWDHQLIFLKRNFSPYAFDLPGFGETSLQGDTLFMGDAAKFIVASLDQIGVNEKAVFVGLSMGGYILLQIAKLFPDRIRSLAFISTRATPDSDEARAKRYKTIEFIQKEGLGPFAEKTVTNLLGKTSFTARPNVVSSVKESILKTDPNSIFAALRGMAVRPDSSLQLSSISVPCYVCWGEEDTFVSRSEMEMMAQALPKADFEVMPKAGHLLNLEEPDRFNQNFVTFLKRRVL